MTDLSFNSIADSSARLIFVLDEDGSFVYANPAWRARLGYDSDELATLKIKALMAAASETSGEVLIPTADSSMLGMQRRVVLLSKDGESVGLEGSFCLSEDNDGKRLAVGMFHEDMSVSSNAEGEQKFRLLFEHSPIGIVMEDTYRIITAANPAFHALLGYEDGELIGRTFEVFRGPETAQPESSLFQQVAAGAPVATGVRQYKKKDGSLISVSVTASPVLDGAGVFTHTIGTMQDLSALRWAEREAATQLRRFRSVFDWAPIGIAILDENTNVVSANHALTRMVGYDASELVGTSLSSLADPGIPLPNSGLYAQLMDGKVESFVLDAALLSAEGKQIRTQSVLAPLPGDDGRPAGAIRMVLDVTRQFDTAKELAEREERFRSIYEKSPLGIALIDADEAISSVNPAMESLLGYTSAELQGRNMRSLRPADAPPNNQGWYGRMIEGDDAPTQSERPYERKDGTVFTGRSTWAPVRGETGEFLYSVRIIEDISEQRRAERMKDEFLAIMGHELRTPLTSINAVLGLLAEGTLGDLGPRVGDLLRLAQNNGARLKNLVDDILDLERLVGSEAELTRVDTDLNGPLSVAWNKTGEKSQKTLSDRIPRNLQVSADAERLEQLFACLLANAVKFSTDGASITVAGYPREDGWAHVSITDRGQGIPTDQIDRVFNRFYQVDSSDSRHAGGTGIGLAIAKQIVEAHGGQIWIESQLGVGSTFWFSLPLSGALPTPL